MKKTLFISLVVGLCLQFYYFSHLPQIVAHNFDAGGLARAGLYKRDYVLFSTLAILGNSIICLIVDSVCRKLPGKYVSFPFKEYWFAEHRKDAAFSKMAKWTDFFGLLVNIFLILLFFLIFLANQTDPPILNMQLFFPLLTLFLVSLLCWATALYFAFRPPQHN